MCRGKGKKTIFFSLVLIIILGLAVYGNSLNNEFIWDDESLIEKNIYIRNVSYIPQIFSEDLGTGDEKEYNFYRPIQTITYMVDYSLWKLDVKGYHLTNILLHICVALGIYCLINMIFKDNLLSLLTGSFFCRSSTSYRGRNLYFRSGRLFGPFIYAVMFYLLYKKFFLKERRHVRPYIIELYISPFIQGK